MPKSCAANGFTSTKLTSKDNSNDTEPASCQGYTQVHNENYFETFAPVVHNTTLRLILSLTALPGFQSYHWDVSTAFINCPLDPNEPPIYCLPPTGYEDQNVYAIFFSLTYTA